MKLSYIITITPVIPIEYLNASILSFNLQSCDDFEVIYYNQTGNTEKEIFDKLLFKPEYDYKWFNIDQNLFFGDYALWDMYGFIQSLIDSNQLYDYFISLHMEEFLDTDYTKTVLEVLSLKSFDILLANLNRTTYYYKDLINLVQINNKPAFQSYIDNNISPGLVKWGLSANIIQLSKNPLKMYQGTILALKQRKIIGGKQLKASKEGYIKLESYQLEDLYFMKTEFAEKYNWFKSEIELYFEDIHINFRLGEALNNITDFPVYFNLAKVYHLCHGKYYFQIQDERFTNAFMDYETDNPALLVLKDSIRKYKDGSFTLREALKYSKKNPLKYGRSDMNVKRCLEIINEQV